MKCLACGQELEQNKDKTACSLCHFPVVEITGDPEAALSKLQPEIDAHKAEFIKGITISLLQYRWTRKNGVIAPPATMSRLFGNLSQLYGNTTWLLMQFDRLSECAVLDVTLQIEMPRQTIRKQVQVPNFPKAKFLELGIRIDRSFRFSMLVRDENGQSLRTDSLPLF